MRSFPGEPGLAPDPSQAKRFVTFRQPLVGKVIEDVRFEVAFRFDTSSERGELRDAHLDRGELELHFLFELDRHVDGQCRPPV